jgi:hypothetical protein
MSDIVNDGLTLFVGQGRIALDAAKHDDGSYSLSVYQRREEYEENDTFLNLSHISGDALEEFEPVRVETFETRGDLLMRILELINAHNQF